MCRQRSDEIIVGDQVVGFLSRLAADGTAEPWSVPASSRQRSHTSGHMRYIQNERITRRLVFSRMLPWPAPVVILICGKATSGRAGSNCVGQDGSPHQADQPLVRAERLELGSVKSVPGQPTVFQVSRFSSICILRVGGIKKKKKKKKWSVDRPRLIVMRKVACVET